ncbi:MAG: zf-HC2 domain-containing protein [Tidjanibacter sp.]|nr:zf-HC2 domain-containing protein [Tidjanibacter sp.]
MNCENFKLNIADLFDEELSAEIKREMLEHIESCDDCKALYEEFSNAIKALTPKQEITPSAEFSARLDKAIAAAEPKRQPVRRVLFRIGGAVASIAAMFLVVVNILPATPAKAASGYFERAATKLGQAQSLFMRLSMRTLPAENFDYTDPSAEFVEHTIQRVGEAWRVDKGDRVAYSDGGQWWQWVESWNNGWKGYGSPSELVSLMVNPHLLLQFEQRLADEFSGVVYETRTDGGCYFVTVTSPALGDWVESNYMYMSSILESDSRREYAFDRRTKELLAASIYMLQGEQQVKVLTLDQIIYNAPMVADDISHLPESIEFVEPLKADSGSSFVGISARQAAIKTFEAMKVWDKELLAEAIPFVDIERLRDDYQGVEILEVKEAVRSGLYVGYFVPMKVKYRNGKSEELMVAMRNDTPSGGWILDGGI